MALYTLAVGLAAAIPKLDLFISLVGAASSSTLALMAPTVIHTMAFWDELSGSKAALVCGRNGLLFTIGFVGFLTGTFVSVGNIIDYFAGVATQLVFPTKIQEMNATYLY